MHKLSVATVDTITYLILSRTVTASKGYGFAILYGSKLWYYSTTNLHSFSTVLVCRMETTKWSRFCLKSDRLIVVTPCILTDVEWACLGHPRSGWTYGKGQNSEDYMSTLSTQRLHFTHSQTSLPLREIVKNRVAAAAAAAAAVGQTKHIRPAQKVRCCA